MHKSPLLAALLVAVAIPAMAATPVAATPQAPEGASIVTSQPGRVEAADVVKATVVVTAVDKAARIVTLKRADGQSFEVLAGEEVKNFDQIKIGDSVVVAYAQALTLQLKKGGVVREHSELSDSATAPVGQKPAAIAAKTVHVVANVVAVDPKASTITLKGPKGNLVELAVKNKDHFNVVKKGDQVEVDYTQALAISVEPAPAPKKKSKK